MLVALRAPARRPNWTNPARKMEEPKVSACGSRRPPCCHAMRLAQLRMPVVYAGSAYQRANPFNCWHLTARFVQSTLMAVAGGRHGETGARLRDAIAAGG